MRSMAAKPPRQSHAQRMLVERLKAGRLTDLDRQQVHRAWVLQTERDGGRGWPTAARLAGYKDTKDAKVFAHGGMYPLYYAYAKKTRPIVEALRETKLALGGDGTPEEAALVERARVRALVPRALDRLEANLGGEDPKSADRAMELVLEGAGLLEPEVARPVVHINQLVVNQQVAISLADDRALMRRVTAEAELVALPAPADG
jgi:hypothetical protein